MAVENRFLARQARRPPASPAAQTDTGARDLLESLPVFVQGRHLPLAARHAARRAADRARRTRRHPARPAAADLVVLPRKRARCRDPARAPDTPGTPSSRNPPDGSACSCGCRPSTPSSHRSPQPGAATATGSAPPAAPTCRSPGSCAWTRRLPPGCCPTSLPWPAPSPTPGRTPPPARRSPGPKVAASSSSSPQRTGPQFLNLAPE